MSIKDELSYVKNELSADEKVLESAFRLESFLKKHKKKIIAGGTLLIAAVIAYNGYEMYQRSKLVAANNALLTLQQNPKDETAWALLRQNAPLLYEHVKLHQAAKEKDLNALEPLTKSGNEPVADMSAYTKGAIESQPKGSLFYKELVLLEEAYVALKRGDKATAREKLEGIDPRSAAAPVAVLLRHATIEVK